MRSLLRRPAALALAFLLNGAFAAPSTQLTVSGIVQNPATYNSASLSALPSPITQTDAFLSGSTPQTHVYTGASLWNLLNAANVIVQPAVKNDILSKIVLVTGSDGYKTVFSLGELDPNFGNRPDLLAYAETINKVQAPLGSDGFARVTAPGDVKGGRYVSNVAGLDVQNSGATVTASGGGLSSQFTVSGSVTAPMTFNLAALAALPQITETVGANTYTGVSFWSLLSSTVGLSLNPAVKNDVLDKYVIATGSDGYQVAFSLGELSSDFGNQPDMIATSVNGQSLGSNGFARLVVPNDVKAGRWVSNLVSLEVLSASPSPVPEPAGRTLMLLGGVVLLSAVAKAEARR